VQRELQRITGHAPSQPTMRPSQLPASTGHPPPAPARATQGHAMLHLAAQGTLHSHPTHEPTSPHASRAPGPKATITHPPPGHLAPLMYGRPPTPSPIAAAASGPHAQPAPGYAPFASLPSGVLRAATSGARPMPAPVPAQVLLPAPRGRRRLALYAGITALLVVAAVILALVTAA